MFPSSFSPLSLLLSFATLGLICAPGIAAPKADVSQKTVNTSADKKVDAKQREFFENKIRPTLIKHCYSCHSANAKELGGKLKMDSKDAMLQGGESGPTLVAGSPEESLLIDALKYNGLEMPPEKPLSEAEIADFEKWIKMGAHDPRDKDSIQSVKNKVVLDPNDPTLWSFRPVHQPKVPQVIDIAWCFNPMDYFVLSKIEANKLSPAADAPSRVLVQRIYFDLTGLPPTAEQVNSFEKAYISDDQLAVEKLIDTLLSSPHFGERWGRHWLDVARYAESNGNDGLSRNPTFPHAWRYRDYVIDAFNADRPYNQFITEQIAGDLLAADTPELEDRQLIATGFLALGSKPAKAMNVNFDMDVVADQVNVVSTAVMGLSVACARCHDHKHDPIPTADYYAMAGIFASTDSLWGLAANEPLTANVTALHVLKTAPKVVVTNQDEIAELTEKSKNPNKAAPKPKFSYPEETPLAMGAKDKAKPADMKINIKGESKKLGPVVPRGFLSACSHSDLEINPKQSGRLELAQWLVDVKHPQTARVMVNRIWQHLFGQGLVHTPDDFGVYGTPPTHPKLLDHLAIRFVENNWSVKRLIREIMLSRTYQQASACNSKTLEVDPNNDLLTRHNRRRLDTESIRDRMLVVSGSLDTTSEEGSRIQYLNILVNTAGDLQQESNHRSIYLCMLRNAEPQELSAFNMADSSKPDGQRDSTTLPSQSLFLLNHPFVTAQSENFAQRILQSADKTSDPAQGIQAAYRIALLREPTSIEQNRAEIAVDQIDQLLLKSIPDADVRRTKVWAAFCQTLMASSEFRYID
ncbi:MAG: PSD1 and planctomycete cytochrome C domain-containing protein [Pirellulales bacterium]